MYREFQATASTGPDPHFCASLIAAFSRSVFLLAPFSVNTVDSSRESPEGFRHGLVGASTPGRTPTTQIPAGLYRVPTTALRHGLLHIPRMPSRANHPSRKLPPTCGRSPGLRYREQVSTVLSGTKQSLGGPKRTYCLDAIRHSFTARNRATARLDVMTLSAPQPTSSGLESCADAKARGAPQDLQKSSNLVLEAARVPYARSSSLQRPFAPRRGFGFASPHADPQSIPNVAG